jgi:hypothetical protein
MVVAITNPAINDDARQQFKNPDPPQIAKSATHAKTLLVSLLRVATLSAELIAVDLASIGIALKQGLVSVEGAVAWLDDLGLCEIVVQGLNTAEGGRQ